MKKEMIKIPANIKYLTEREKFIEEFGKPFELPRYPAVEQLQSH